MIQQPHSRAYIQRKLWLQQVHSPPFIAALLTLVKTWKQPKCPLKEEWIKMWYMYIYTHNGIPPIIKEWNNAICSSMNGPRYYHGEWSKSDRKKTIIIWCHVHLVIQPCLTLCRPMDCSPPGSSVLGSTLSKNAGMGCHVLLQWVFPTQESNRGLPHCRQILYQLSYQGSLISLICEI